MKTYSMLLVCTVLHILQRSFSKIFSKNIVSKQHNEFIKNFHYVLHQSTFKYSNKINIHKWLELQVK